MLAHAWGGGEPIVPHYGEPRSRSREEYRMPVEPIRDGQ
jgi:hypothetical protein